MNKYECWKERNKTTLKNEFCLKVSEIFESFCLKEWEKLQ